MTIPVPDRWCARCDAEHDESRCRAHVRRDDGGLRQCKRYPIAGAVVCGTHGGRAGQVKRRALERLALREALEQSPRRPPVLVLLDCVHSLDVLERQARAGLGAGATAEQVDRWLGQVLAAASMARVALAAEAESRAAAAAEKAATADRLEQWTPEQRRERLRQIHDEIGRRLSIGDDR